MVVTVEQLPRIRLTPRLVRDVVDRTRTTAMFERIARQAPYAAVLRAPGREEVILSHPDLAREVLVTQGRAFGKGEGLLRTRFLLGDGLLTADRELHRRQRPIVQPAFARARMGAYAADMVDAAQQHVGGWRAGEVVDMAAEMQRLTLAAVGRTLLGADTGREAAARVAPALSTVLRAWEVLLLPGTQRLLDAPLPGPARARAALAELDDLVTGVVADARRRGPGEDAVSALLAAQDEAGTDDQQVRDEVMTLLLAGHETTANALVWTLHLLSDHPHVADRLRRELAALGDRDAAYGDLPGLPYAYAVVAESMRLFPPAWILERAALEDVQVGDLAVPAGTNIVFSTWVLHRDPRSWSSPLAFAPERWLGPDGGFDEAAPGQPKGAWQPFGGGTRMCIGESFAWTEAVLLLAVVLRRWAPRRVPDQRVGTRAAITLRPAWGMQMELVPVERKG